MKMPVAFLSLMIAGVSALSGAEVLPDGVEDPFGLGPRLALIDHLKEQHGIAMPPGSTWGDVLARYQGIPKLMSDEERLAIDARHRMRASLGIKDDVTLTDEELHRRFEVHKEAERRAFGASSLARDLNQPQYITEKKPTNPGSQQSPDHTAPVIRGSKQQQAASPVLLIPKGQLRELPPNDPRNDNNVFKWQFATNGYTVLCTEQNKHLAPVVAAHAQAFQKSAVPFMRLDRQPRLRGSAISIRVFATRQEYLSSQVNPPSASAGVCRIGVDQFGHADHITVFVYGTKMSNLKRVLQHELTHALHAAAFGRLTHSWYAEGLAAFFEQWDVTATNKQNIRRRPRILARLPYIRYQSSIDKVPDLGSFWETSWQSDNPYRYQIAEAFMDYLLLRNEKMLKRCHQKCRAEAAPHRYFSKTELKDLNKDFHKHIKESFASSE